MMYSKQLIYCNCCGKQIDIEFPKLLGREFKVCSLDCLEEIKWRETLSILGETYKEKK